jgi:hypothetical protein
LDRHLLQLILKHSNLVTSDFTEAFPPAVKDQEIEVTSLHGISDSHSDEYEINIFWDVTPCSPLAVTRRFGGMYAYIFRIKRSQARSKQVSACRLFVGCLDYLCILKMEAICSYEISVNFYRTNSVRS